ncbi:hypothetical protein GCM10025877_00920 [Agromyces mangrovi Wang et al. 2018]|nr:hypothetical protein GCM10025877_00920 [Agromyces mangrovi]
MPPIPPLVTITAGARSSNSPVSVRFDVSPIGVARRQHGATDAHDAAVLDDQGVDPVAVSCGRRALVHRLAHPLDERLQHAGPGAPGDVEPGHGVAVPGGEAAAALGPADDREEADPALAQPRALLAGGELEVGVGPPTSPEVVVAVESGRPVPVLTGQCERVVHAHRALFGRVDEEEPAERPPGLTAERRLGLLFDDDDAAPLLGELGGGDETGETGPHHDRIGMIEVGSGHADSFVASGA